MWTLFHSPGSCAMASFIALEEAGAPYRVQRVNFAASEQHAPAYRAINPKGRVPALATERGILTETPAILGFIAESCPVAGLLPVGDPWAVAQAQSFNAYLCATVHVNHAHGRRAARWTDDTAAQAALAAYVPTTMAAAFALIEAGMLQGPWVLGERFSVCDPYLFTIASWLEGDGVPLASLPRVAAHFARMQERPSVQKALAFTG
jgi:glutathione S-transferase